MSQKIKINYFLEEEALMETKQGSKLMVRGISMSSVNVSRLQSRQRGFPPPVQCWDSHDYTAQAQATLSSG